MHVALSCRNVFSAIDMNMLPVIVNLINCHAKKINILTTYSWHQPSQIMQH